jgi:lysophospholipase L1-like esterase
VHLLKRLAVAAATAIVVLAGTGTTPAAHATPPAYVALGDSYSSGTGTRSYLADGTACQRSAYAYPSLLAAAGGYALDFRACSGATVADVTRAQLGSLSASTGYVTISVGGNDAGFASVLTTCAQPAWLSNCNAAVDRAQRFIDTTLPAALSELYAAIRSRAPQAKVVVVGYPRLFNGTDCNALTWFSATEMSRLNATADLLNRRTAAAAAARGFGFANPTSAFTGRAVCDRPEWINGLSLPVTESYHPKTTGHAYGYAPTVGPQLTGAAVRVGATALAEAGRSAGTLAARQREHAALDRSIRPQRFVVPDLHSPRALRAAARAGVDVDDPASVAAADRRFTRLQEAARAPR